VGVDAAVGTGVGTGVGPAGIAVGARLQPTASANSNNGSKNFFIRSTLHLEVGLIIAMYLRTVQASGSSRQRARTRLSSCLYPAFHILLFKAVQQGREVRLNQREHSVRFLQALLKGRVTIAMQLEPAFRNLV
jgi:hypothetical protein